VILHLRRHGWSAPAVGRVAGGCRASSTPCDSDAAWGPVSPTTSFGSGWWSAGGVVAAVSRDGRCGCPAPFAAAPASIEAAGAAGVYAAFAAAARVPCHSPFSAGACVPTKSVFFSVAIWSGGGFVPADGHCYCFPVAFSTGSKYCCQEQAQEEKECCLFYFSKCTSAADAFYSVLVSVHAGSLGWYG
jgi:hypothetical protein